jgi:hypothetical protein
LDGRVNLFNSECGVMVRKKPTLKETEEKLDDVSTLDYYAPISPVGDGTMPLSAAVHWIASEGFKIGLLLTGAEPRYRAAAIELRNKIISEKVRTHGENLDGDFELIPAIEFEELKFTFDFAEGVQDIAARESRIEVVPSENALPLDCFFKARSHRPIWTKLVVRREDVRREWPFKQFQPVRRQASLGKKPLIQLYLQDKFPTGVPAPAIAPRKALKAEIEKSEYATKHPQLKSIDEATLKAAIDEFNAVLRMR